MVSVITANVKTTKSLLLRVLRRETMTVPNDSDASETGVYRHNGAILWRTRPLNVEIALFILYSID